MMRLATTLRLSAAMMILASLLACAPRSAPRAGDPSAAVGGDSLHVTVDAPNRALVLQNPDTAAAYFTIFERRLAALVDWVPCRLPVPCPNVPPRGSRRVAFDSIGGYDAEATEVIVYWWKWKRAAGGTFAMDSMRSRIVPIRPVTR